MSLDSNPSEISHDPKHLALERIRLHRSSMNEIAPGLYLSGQEAALNKNLLNEKKITHILNLATNVDNKFESEIAYKKIKIEDSTTQDIMGCFDESFDYIENALKDEHNSVLVHCNAGVSRSASVVISYLMKKGLHQTYQEAFEHVLSCRSIISPNTGFVEQLVLLENKLDSNSN